MRIAKYTIVGAINTITAYIFFIVLIHYGMNYQYALFMDYALGLILGYFLNRYWTFSDRNNIKFGFTKYIITYIIIFIINSTLLALVVEFNIMKPELGQLFILAIITLFSYLAQKNWVFINHINKK